MVAVPIDTSLRAVMITTAKTKVARAVKREATAMADRDLYTAVLSRLALPEECPFYN